MRVCRERTDRTRAWRDDRMEAAALHFLSAHGTILLTEVAAWRSAMANLPGTTFAAANVC